jgi:hypothetical protein
MLDIKCKVSGKRFKSEVKVCAAGCRFQLIFELKTASQHPGVEGLPSILASKPPSVEGHPSIQAGVIKNSKLKY